MDETRDGENEARIEIKKLVEEYSRNQKNENVKIQNDEIRKRQNRRI